MTDLSRRELNRIAKERRLLDAALSVFSRLGYSGTSMDAVADAAGLSKPTLYHYFDNKETLFKAMMRSRRDDMLLAFDQPTSDAMIRQLHSFAAGYAQTVMRPDMLSLARLIIGEAQRFPEIGKAYQASGPDRVLDGMIAYLTSLKTAGRLNFESAEMAAQDLWGLILSGPRTRALHDPDWQPKPSELEQNVNNGLRVFLKAYSTDPNADLAELDTISS